MRIRINHELLEIVPITYEEENQMELLKCLLDSGDMELSNPRFSYNPGMSRNIYTLELTINKEK
jgi:hypothetical protein